MLEGNELAEMKHARKEVDLPAAPRRCGFPCGPELFIKRARRCLGEFFWKSTGAEDVTACK